MGLRASRTLSSVAFVILICLVSAATQADEPRPCWYVGGIDQGNDCYCQISNVYVNPNESSCFEKTIGWLDGINSTQKNGCHTPSATKILADAIPVDLICSDPAKYLCDPKKNPKLREILRQEMRNQESYVQMMEDPSFDRFFPPVVGGTVTPPPARLCNQPRTFGPDTMGKIQECDSHLDVLLKERLPDDAKWRQETDQIFHDSVNEAISYLDARIEKLRNRPSQKNSGLIAELEKSKARLNETRLIISNSILPGLTATMDTSGKPIVRTEGIHWMAGVAPEGLRFLIMHELGHIADPISTSVERNQGMTSHPAVPKYRPELNPFESDLQCLSSFVQKNDISCAQKAVSADAGLATIFQKAEEIYAKNPYVSLGAYAKVAHYCGNAQFVESFADHFATEVYSRRKRSNSRFSETLSEVTGLFCSLKLGQESELSQDINGTGRLRANDHPLGSRRVEMILANPRIRKSLGCTSPAQFRSVYGLPPVRSCKGLP